MGTALEVAQYAHQHLTSRGHKCRLNTNFSAGELAQATQEITLVCTSNTGMGDLPANIAPLLSHLSSDYPNIAGAKFAVINLGDSSYPNFAQAGNTLHEALLDLGATPINQMLVIDAIYDDDPIEPLKTWLPTLEAQL